MSTLIIYVLFLMLYVLHIYLVTLRSLPFAWIESRFLDKLSLHRELKLIMQRWKLYTAGLSQKTSHFLDMLSLHREFDALSGRYSLLTQLDYKIFGLETIKDQYVHDADFKDVLLHCKDGKTWNKFVSMMGLRFELTSYAFQLVPFAYCCYRKHMELG
jgi:hypothetical protein